jgi:hypothetical protein
MDALLSQELHCPYCGERITAEAESGSGNHSFIEDCPVCCQPIEYQIVIDADPEAGETWRLEARRDDDA